MTAKGRAEARMAAALAKRCVVGTLRSAQYRMPEREMIDFSSNDYLGIAQKKSVYKEYIDEEMLHVERSGRQLSGSTGSRLLTGCSSAHDDLERWIAEFHGWPRAVLFGSGYAANSGVAACVATESDIVLYDELSHNCTRFGLSRGRQHTTLSFRHNDAEVLETSIKSLRTNHHDSTIFIFVESVYSMDGDAAPLKAYAQVCRSDGNACLIIDEAHATGVLGMNGRGAAVVDDISDVTICCVYTFGKAIGCHGAVVACSETMATYLENYAQPLIYTTAPSPASSRLALRCYQAVAGDQGNAARAQLNCVISTLRKALSDALQEFSTSSIKLLPSASPIHALLVPGTKRVLSLATTLQKAGFDVRPIRSPTVQPGTERLRIVAHAHNTSEEALALVAAIKDAISLLLSSTSAFDVEESS